jgi:hypothetical protein
MKSLRLTLGGGLLLSLGIVIGMNLTDLQDPAQEDPRVGALEGAPDSDPDHDETVSAIEALDFAAVLTHRRSEPLATQWSHLEGQSDSLGHGDAPEDATLDIPDESLPPEPVDEAGAAEDYARFEDGPVPRNSNGDRGSGASGNHHSNEEREACFAAYASCRRDRDCCGTSVCRSRPGSISGHFLCTPA